MTSIRNTYVSKLSKHSLRFHFSCFGSNYRRCSIKKVFLKMSQNLQENISARVSVLIKLQGKLVQNTVVRKAVHFLVNESSGRVIQGFLPFFHCSLKNIWNVSQGRFWCVVFKEFRKIHIKMPALQVCVGVSFNEVSGYRSATLL